MELELGLSAQGPYFQPPASSRQLSEERAPMRASRERRLVDRL